MDKSPCQLAMDYHSRSLVRCDRTVSIDLCFLVTHPGTWDRDCELQNSRQPESVVVEHVCFYCRFLARCNALVGSQLHADR